MGIPLSAAVTLGLLFFLSVGLNEQVAEGCECMARHPQQLFCASDIVIRAKITGKKVISTPHGLTAYSVKTIKTYKSVNKKPIRYIYSHQTSCEVTLENDEYLLSGNVEDGMIFIDLCNLVKHWNHVSSFEKRYLSIYQRGCDCEISPCTGASCLIKMLQKKCLMRVKDLFIIDDEEALQSICLQSSDGFCRWNKPR
ncbi:metalloproteinase inhibitor 3-like [Garra rufa]|uniref:metalloproteinase inhibitor 3-like n=1 Tax=Garra rufa TaxID=137080 RepID=UPI003CCED7F1